MRAKTLTPVGVARMLKEVASVNFMEPTATGWIQDLRDNLVDYVMASVQEESETDTKRSRFVDFADDLADILEDEPCQKSDG